VHGEIGCWVVCGRSLLERLILLLMPAHILL
jgi:hypothetical protein